jgi:ubiquinone/menaquinone biosynthesis C-methylase UbiE
MTHSIIQRLVGNARAYDVIQRVVGRGRILGRIASYVSKLEGQTVLDIGAGTGALHQVIPNSATYIWLDNDSQKLRGYLRNTALPIGALGDATTLCIDDKSVDVAVSVCMTHHLPDKAFTSMLQEAGRVAKRRLILIDALRCPRRVVSNCLWALDRGSYPRTLQEMQERIERTFRLTHCETFTVFHKYVLYVGEPR